MQGCEVIRMEKLIKKLENAKSVLILIHNDLGNPEGTIIESHMQNAIELVMDNIENAIDYINI